MFLNYEINLFIETILLNLEKYVTIFLLILILNNRSSRSNDILAMPILCFLGGDLSIPNEFSCEGIEKAAIDCNENIFVFAWAHTCIFWWTGEWSNDAIFNFITFYAKLIVTLGFAHIRFLVIGQIDVAASALWDLVIKEAPLSTRFFITIITLLVTIVIISFDW